MNFPNYPEILKIFYRYSFPDHLGANGSSLAQALIYKANDLYFPPYFKMSNTELSHLSGVLINNIGRTRQNVLDVCEFDGVPMFTYVDSGKRLAGKYTINYAILSDRLQVDINVLSNSRQKQGEIDNDPNTTKHNSTPKNNNNDDDDFSDNDRVAPAINTKDPKMPDTHSPSQQPGHNNGQLPNGMNVKAFYKLIEFKVGIVKRGMSDHQAYIDYLTTVPEDRLRTVVEHAIKDNTAPRYGLSYIYEHCDQWDYWQKKWMPEPGAKEDRELAMMRTELAECREQGLHELADKLEIAIAKREGI